MLPTGDTGPGGVCPGATAGEDGPAQAGPDTGTDTTTVTRESWTMAAEIMTGDIMTTERTERRSKERKGERKEERIEGKTGGRAEERIEGKTGEQKNRREGREGIEEMIGLLGQSTFLHRIWTEDTRDLSPETLLVSST